MVSSDSEPGQASLKPYLVRALYQWAIDHGLTPQLLVDAAAAEVAVPAERVREGRIVLSIHPQAVRGLELGDRYLLFSARFAGKPFEVCVPMAAILAVYCRENGRGIAFQAEDEQPPASDDGRTAGEKNPDGKNRDEKRKAAPHLTLIK